MESSDIAIIGMAGRFPQAPDLERFWQLLAFGREAVVAYSDEELLAAGVDAALIQHPDYVKSGTFIEGFDCFDADFFDMSAQDAAITDPQQRLFMECVWHALEHAGYPPGDDGVRIGLYAGVGDNRYLHYNLEPNMDQLRATAGDYRIATLSGKDFIATRIAYKLNLTGPAITVQTACSTSLVAVHVAAQSLLNMECDIALAGGVSLELPARQGYLYQEGMILSPDGHCRAFDARAQGTFSGSGVGAVALKRLEDALADGDTIHAVIRGSAVNNDGHRKIGYTAPSVQGQAEVIADALAMAEVGADQIRYVEAHGTGTALGDPIEVAALTQAFRQHTHARRHCAIGSVKSNIGHADTAAGIAGLLKVALALGHRQIPPSLHFSQPNPEIDFDDSPFYVNTRLTPWPDADEVRPHAGVSSFGVGGTNAHVILAEAPPEQGEGKQESGTGPRRQEWLLCLSARSHEALEACCRQLADHLRGHRRQSLADIAFTLQLGRRAFDQRRVIVCGDHEEAARSLEATDTPVPRPRTGDRPAIAFLFPGQGSQYLNMGRELYEREPLFRDTLDQCAELLAAPLGEDIRRVIFSDEPRDGERLQQTQYTQAALFSLEYALAKCWMAWGIVPDMMLGHSIGEYVAACLAEVFTLPEALALVAMRGRLIQQLPPATMLAVPLSEAAVRPWLSEELSLSVVNGARRCVIGGTATAIDDLRRRLAAEGIDGQPLHTSHAFHSHLLTPVLEPFAQQLRKITLRPPMRPFLSNLSGQPIRAEQATSVQYWLDHLRHTVQFHACLGHLLRPQGMDILLEVGPRHSLSMLARRHPGYAEHLSLLTSMPRAPQANPAPSESRHILATLGELWARHAEVDWAAFHGEARRRVPLPGYPFARDRHWLDAPHASAGPAGAPSDGSWLYRPLWVRQPLAATGPSEPPAHWLLFLDSDDSLAPLLAAMGRQGDTLTRVYPGEGFKQRSSGEYEIDPQSPEDYRQLVARLAQQGFPSHILHAWLFTPQRTAAWEEEGNRPLLLGFYCLLYLLQAMTRANIDRPLLINIIADRLHAIGEGDQPSPARAAVLGALETIQREMPEIRCRAIDSEYPAPWDRLAAELASGIESTRIAYRRGRRWLQSYERLQWQPLVPTRRLRPQGVYLITGGLGGIGLTLAEHLAEEVQARLILVSRRAEIDPATSERLAAIDKKGGEILRVCADVTDEAQMGRVIEQGRQRFAAIHGVIHAAGLPDGALIANQTGAEAILAPKVDGTLVLHRLLAEQPQPLDFFVLCSSLSSIMGAAGQIAYCAANQFLDTFAHSQRHHPTTLYTAINWDSWQGVGMAVASVKRRSLPDDRDMVALRHPLFSGYRVEQGGIRYRGLLDEGLWILADHRILGPERVVMPGTGYLEWTRAAVRHQLSADDDGGLALIWRDLYFMQPLIIENGERKTIDLLLTPIDDGFEFVISGSDDAGEPMEHARGRLSTSPAAAMAVESIDQILDRCQRRSWHVAADFAARPTDQCNALERALRAYGPHWHYLRQVHAGEGEGLAYLALPDDAVAELADHPLHPGLLDMATGFLGMADGDGGTGLPFHYEKVVLYRPLPPRLYSHARLRSAPPSEYRMDLVLMDEQGEVVMTIEGYTFRDAQPAITPLSGQPSRADQQASRALSYGFTPAEGAAVFRQVLEHGEPQVLTSKLDLMALLMQGDEPTAEPAPRRKRAIVKRPALGNHYLPPTTELEHRLVAAWQGFLAIEPIGIGDDFFSLGGDSLLAIQLVAYLRAELGLDLAAQALLNTPTIRALAALLQPAEGDSAQVSPLIEINQGDASHPALFLFHPVGGHVVHYRLLASHLAKEQAVYAVQAQGLDGEAEPIDSVPEMAARYIDYIRERQPEGPYLLGGYSSGGMTAYEMARQLTLQGETVSLLAMIDSGWPHSITAYGPDDEVEVMVDLLELSQERAISTDELAAMEAASRWRWFVEQMEGDFSPTSQRRARAFMDVFRANTLAISTYRPEPWQGTALFFSATERDDPGPGQEEAWAKLTTPTMEICHVAGNHVSIMTEERHVRYIAERLHNTMSKVL